MKKGIGEELLRKLLRTGKAEGILSYQEVWECFRNAGLSSAEEDVIYRGMGAAGIKLIDETEKVFTEGTEMDDEKPFLLRTPEEVTCLIRQIRQGDKKAAEELLKTKRNLVKGIAKKYKHHGMTFFELMQAGNRGLLKAAEVFDSDEGLSCGSGAAWWIRQEIIRTLAENLETAKISLSTVKRINQMIAGARKWKEERGTDPGTEELAEVMQTREEEVLELKSLGRKPALIETESKKEIRIDPRQNSRKRKAGTPPDSTEN